MKKSRFSSLCNCLSSIGSAVVDAGASAALRISGRQIGRIKSEKTTAVSSRIRAAVDPSTGDFTIPICVKKEQSIYIRNASLAQKRRRSLTMRRRCIHGVLAPNRILPNAAIHVALAWPWKQESVVKTHVSETRVPSQTCVSSRCNVTCHGQSPGAAIFGKLNAELVVSIDWMPHSVKNKVNVFVRIEPETEFNRQNSPSWEHETCKASLPSQVVRTNEISAALGSKTRTKRVLFSVSFRNSECCIFLKWNGDPLISVEHFLRSSTHS